ncbi:hypothetical protein [Microbacterium capsulatum]|uniref:Uncharacterized protein n=1 Tax=Microbacterium capsulatum TaxID=3041921 RepID=A0ABU0XFZ8_9MICO|nr:hypothetical protein [Microbacterium sp. ASV81]MDQ4214049.1 hypothetical protein [Microbacterium sp. ASV81]
MNQRHVHICHEIEHTGTFNGLGPMSERLLLDTDSALSIVRGLRFHDEEPAAAVIRDYQARLGMTDRSPATLLRQIDQWLRLTHRYISGEVIILPHDTAQAWGGPVESEEAFVFVAQGVLAIAANVIRAYESKYPPEVAVKLLDSTASQPPRGEELAWPWDDSEDMVARIVEAPMPRLNQERERPRATDEERGSLRAHFALGFDLTEIRDHLDLAQEIVFDEHMSWWHDLERTGQLDGPDGDAA